MTWTVQIFDDAPHAAKVAAAFAVGDQQAQMEIEHDQPEREGGGQHGAGAQQITAEARFKHGVPHVVRNGLVLGFFQRVPGPHLRIAFHRAADARRVFQQQGRQHRGVVFEADGDGELIRMWQHFAAEIEDRPQPLVELVRRQPGFLQQVVVFDVLARMHGFLADEAEHLFFQHGVVDLVAIVAHAIHEETLARRE